MANSSVADFASFINQQIKIQEKIESCLWKLEAMMAVAVMEDEFFELSKNILCSYFSVACDLVEEAMKANQESLSALLKRD